jgi:predicted ATPase
MRGWTMTRRGRLDDGIVQIREGIAAFRATKAEVIVPYFLGLLAEAHGRAGQAKKGLSLLAEAQDVANHGAECWWEAELYRLIGELTLNQSEVHDLTFDNQQKAEEHFSEALNIAVHQNAKSLELRAALSLCRLWLGQNKRAEAHRVLCWQGSIARSWKDSKQQI